MRPHRAAGKRLGLARALDDVLSEVTSDVLGQVLRRTDRTEFAANVPESPGGLPVDEPPAVEPAGHNPEAVLELEERLTLRRRQRRLPPLRRVDEANDCPRPHTLDLALRWQS